MRTLLVRRHANGEDSECDRYSSDPSDNRNYACDVNANTGFKFIDPTQNDWAPRLGGSRRPPCCGGGFGIYWNDNQLNTCTLTTQNYPPSDSVAYNGQSTNFFTFANPTGLGRYSRRGFPVWDGTIIDA